MVFTVSDKDISDTQTWFLPRDLVICLIILLHGKDILEKTFSTTLNIILRSLLDSEGIPKSDVIPPVVWTHGWVHDGSSDVQQSLCMVLQYWKHAEEQRGHTYNEECPLESRKTKRLVLSAMKFLYHYEPTEYLFLAHIYVCKSTASPKWGAVF